MLSFIYVGQIKVCNMVSNPRIELGFGTRERREGADW